MTTESFNVWVVYSYWGPGSMDPMCLIESVWTDEDAARTHAASKHYSVDKVLTNTPEGYED